MKQTISTTSRLLALMIIILSSRVSLAQVYNTGNLYVAPGANASFWGTFTNSSTGAVSQSGTVYINGDANIAGNLTLDPAASTQFYGATWTNASTATFSGTGTVTFAGTAAQTIDGGYTSGSQPAFPGLEINNSNNVSLVNSAAAVSNSLLFTAGSIVLGSNNLNLTASATVSGAGAGKFAVTNGTGYLVKQGVAASSSFTFPVGQALNDYTPASVSNTSGAAKTYNVNVKNYSSSTPDEGSSISGADRTWQVFADAAGTADLTLVHNAVTNANGPASGGAGFNPLAAYITQQVADGNWTTSTTTSNGGTPVNTIASAAAVTLPALASDATGYFTKSSDIMSSLSKTIMVTPRTLLQGAYSSGGNMTTTLRNANLIPLTQPYTAAPFNYSGAETVSAIPAGVTDWILVDIRNAATPTTIVATRAAFLKSDGTITDLDGVSPLRFKTVTAGTYVVGVRHRNHLAIRAASSQSYALETNTSYDFRTAQSNAYQNGAITANAAMRDLGGGFFGMWAGNANGNANVRLAGPSNDYSQILNNALSGNSSTILTSVYSPADLNLNGTVRLAGPSNEYNLLLNIVLGGNSSLILNQHL